MADPLGIAGSMRLNYMRQWLQVDTVSCLVIVHILLPDRVSHTYTLKCSSRHELELFRRILRSLT